MNFPLTLVAVHVTRKVVKETAEDNSTCTKRDLAQQYKTKKTNLVNWKPGIQKPKKIFPFQVKQGEIATKYAKQLSNHTSKWQSANTPGFFWIYQLHQECAFSTSCQHFQEQMYEIDITVCGGISSPDGKLCAFAN